MSLYKIFSRRPRRWHWVRRCWLGCIRLWWRRWHWWNLILCGSCSSEIPRFSWYLILAHCKLIPSWPAFQILAFVLQFMHIHSIHSNWWAMHQQYWIFLCANQRMIKFADLLAYLIIRFCSANVKYDQCETWSMLLLCSTCVGFVILFWKLNKVIQSIFNPNSNVIYPLLNYSHTFGTFDGPLFNTRGEVQ